MSQHYHTPITLAAPADASTHNNPMGQLDSAIFDFASGVLAFGNLRFEIGPTLPIVANAIAITRDVHPINTTGTLATINGGSDGDILFLYATGGATVTLDTGTGNIFLNGGSDLFISGNQVIMLFMHNSVWSDLAFGSIPATGTLVPRTELSGDGAISITIPASSFKLMEVYLELRSDYTTGKFDDIRVRFNADTTAANYENLSSYWNSVGQTANAYTGTESGMRFNRAAANNSSPSNYFSGLVIRVFHFNEAAVYKTAEMEGFTPGDNAGADMYINMGGGQWKNAAAVISSIQIGLVNGANWKTGSAYTVKGY